MTRREFDLATKRVLRGESVQAYRRERGRVDGRDWLATRAPGRVQYQAALRAIGAGRGSSALRAIVHAFES